ncbi:hypothetical protein pipiens_014455 [Culex pipiens pipiens]|uniref:Mre11 DNA-binding domain-containing protein n=1 Tax=Culex pipiens pipiens TaxID=38569 RepID=A0ABD1CV33_CULPP
MVLHQNLADRGPKNYMPEKSLTAEGESFDKRCGILSIHKSLFRMNPIKLQTLDEGDVQQKVQNFAAEKVEEMIERAKGKCAEEVVHRFKEVDPDKQLEVLSAKSMTELTRRIVDYEDDDAAELIIMFYERQGMTHLDAVADAINEDNIDEVLAGFYEKEPTTYNDMLKMLHSRIQKRGDPNPPRGSLITMTTTLA